MQLQRRPSAHVPADLGAALAHVRQHGGHRPAITVIRPDGREEQGFATLAQWAAKGAHLLEIDAMLEPGDHLLLDGPPGWMAAAVCLAAWASGIGVVTDRDHPLAASCTVAVFHDSRPTPEHDDVWVWGDAADGSPADADAGDGAEPWAIAVQAFPDAPPPSRASADLPALVADGHAFTQAELIARAVALPQDGVLGLDGVTRPASWIPALVVRPLVTLRSTLLLDRADRLAASGEGVGAWLGGGSVS